LINDEVETKHRRAVANVIENHLDPNVIIYHTEKKLKETIASIDDFKKYDEALEMIQEVPDIHRLKCSLMLAIKYHKVISQDRGLQVSFFNKIILPNLELVPEFKQLTEKEVKIL
jgi:hypothetical protein